MQADSQKLIAYGKVLEDDNKSLKDYSIKEGDFLVVMVSKVRKTKIWKQNSLLFYSPSQLPSLLKLSPLPSPHQLLPLLRLHLRLPLSPLPFSNQSPNQTLPPQLQLHLVSPHSPQSRRSLSTTW
jgi:hypothetical protein